MKAFWLARSLAEKVFLAAAPVHAALLAVGTPFAAITSFVLWIAGLIIAFQWTRAIVRRTIWRLRNRLMVSYLFIAGVPITLLLALVCLGLYILVGQMAIFAVHTELQRYKSDSIPTREDLAGLVPGIGDVLLLQGPGPITLEKSVQDFRRVQVPPAANRFDVEVTWFSLVTFRAQKAMLVVRSRPSTILRGLFGQGLEWQQIAFVAATGVGILFLLAELISIVIGVSITRTITRAVHELYVATQRVKVGDFSHRIPVKGNDQLADLSVSFNIMTVNLQRLIEVEKEKERLHSELEIARDVQARLFPKGAPAMRTLQMSGVCAPARMVSGDYYDFLLVDGSHMAVAIGDVAGKGISAALLMAGIQSVMRTELSDATRISPAQVVSLLNRQLYASTAPEKYATFFLGMYDEFNSKLVYTNAGHLPPVLVHHGQAHALDVTGTVVGVFPFSKYEEREVQLEPGDLLVAYTDGITEPENAYGVMFGEERLMELVVKHQSAPTEEIIARTMEAVRQWSHSPEQEDDMTMVVARRCA